MRHHRVIHFSDLYRHGLTIAIAIFGRLHCAGLNAAHADTEAALGAPLLRIGLIVPETGPLAEFGAAIRNGITLATEDEPRLAQTMRLYFEDSRYDSKIAVSALQKLRTVDRVHAAYVFGGPMSDALAPIADRVALPLISTEYDVRYTKDRKYVLRFANNAADFAAALLDELRGRGLRRFGIMKVENQYHNTLYGAFTEQLQAAETTDLLHNFPAGETDFRSAIEKLRNRHFDALGIYLTPGMQHAFLSQLMASRIHYPIFGTDSFESREENRGIESLTEGAFYASAAVADEFTARYRERFGNIARLSQAALAYEFMRLLTDLFAQSPAAPNADEFMRMIAIKGSRRGVCGEFFFRNTPASGRYFSFPIAIREIRSGSPEVIKVQPAP